MKPVVEMGLWYQPSHIAEKNGFNKRRLNSTECSKKKVSGV